MKGPETQQLGPLKKWQLGLHKPQANSAAFMTTTGKMERKEVLRVELQILRAEHRDLDDAIAALGQNPGADPLSLRRLKKQKLHLKDSIARLEDEILPDIIA